MWISRWKQIWNKSNYINNKHFANMNGTIFENGLPRGIQEGKKWRNIAIKELFDNTNHINPDYKLFKKFVWPPTGNRAWICVTFAFYQSRNPVHYFTRLFFCPLQIIEFSTSWCFWLLTHGKKDFFVWHNVILYHTLLFWQASGTHRYNSLNVYNWCFVLFFFSKIEVIYKDQRNTPETICSTVASGSLP